MGFFDQTTTSFAPNPEPPGFDLLRDMLMRKSFGLQSDPFGGAQPRSAGLNAAPAFGGSGYSGQNTPDWFYGAGAGAGAGQSGQDGSGGQPQDRQPVLANLLQRLTRSLPARQTGSFFNQLAQVRAQRGGQPGGGGAKRIVGRAPAFDGNSYVANDANTAPPFQPPTMPQPMGQSRFGPNGIYGGAGIGLPQLQQAFQQGGFGGNVGMNGYSPTIDIGGGQMLNTDHGAAFYNHLRQLMGNSPQAMANAGHLSNMARENAEFNRQKAGYGLGPNASYQDLINAVRSGQRQNANNIHEAGYGDQAYQNYLQARANRQPGPGNAANQAGLQAGLAAFHNTAAGGGGQQPGPPPILPFPPVPQQGGTATAVTNPPIDYQDNTGKTTGGPQTVANNRTTTTVNR